MPIGFLQCWRNTLLESRTSNCWPESRSLQSGRAHLLPHMSKLHLFEKSFGCQNFKVNGWAIFWARIKQLLLWMQLPQVQRTFWEWESLSSFCFGRCSENFWYWTIESTHLLEKYFTCCLCALRKTLGTLEKNVWVRLCVSEFYLRFSLPFGLS